MEQYFCVICREILINPVTLPCKHTSCEVCLEKTLECNRYQCFLCRKFIGSWYRNSKRRNQLVNESLQKDINSKFPDLVIKKLNGESIGQLTSPVCSNPFIDIFSFVSFTQISFPRVQQGLARPAR